MQQQTPVCLSRAILADLDAADAGGRWVAWQQSLQDVRLVAHTVLTSTGCQQAAGLSQIDDQPGSGDPLVEHWQLLQQVGRALAAQANTSRDQVEQRGGR